jgi:hypothetical protein
MLQTLQVALLAGKVKIFLDFTCELRAETNKVTASVTLRQVNVISTP